MEQRAADAQQVLAKKDEQLERQLQIKDQRDMLVRIGEIQTELTRVHAKVDSKEDEIELEQTAKKSEDEFLENFFKGTASDLQDSANKLDDLMNQVNLPSDQENQLSKAASAAHDTAHDLERIDPKALQPAIDSRLTSCPKLRKVWSKPTRSYRRWPIARA